MVTITAVGEPERPKTYYERLIESRQLLQAAREAIDMAERKLETYHNSLSRMSGVYKGYQRAEYEASASRARIAAMDEITEAVKHLGDAMTTWWPNLSLTYWVTQNEPPAA